MGELKALYHRTQTISLNANRRGLTQASVEKVTPQTRGWNQLVSVFTTRLIELKVEANTVRCLILEFDRRFPGLGRQIDEGTALAIDGEIFQDAHLAQLKRESEIYPIPEIGGG